MLPRCASLKPELGPNSKSEIHWQKFTQDIDIAEYRPDTSGLFGENIRQRLGIRYPITIVKIDLRSYDLRLFSSKELTEGMPQNIRLANLRTVEEWANENDLTAVVNAGMFEGDFLTSAGYMEHESYFVNPRLHPDYNFILAFNPKTNGVERVRMYDLTETQLDEIREDYGTLIQNMRMISDGNKNHWRQKDLIWSTVALGFSSSGDLYFVHSRTPFTVHDLNQTLIEAPGLELENLMYLEGGPEASIILRSLDKGVIRRAGSYETKFAEHDNNHSYWPLPNAIGLSKKIT